MTDLSTTWTGLAPAYRRLRRLTSLIGNVIWCGGATGGAWAATGDPRIGIPVGAAGLAWTVYRVVRAGRWVDAFRFCERDQDLVISSGLWNRSLHVIPYARMQAVMMDAGPLDRLFGVTRVRLVTASPQSSAYLPGLTAQDARVLRDRLIERGEALATPL